MRVFFVNGKYNEKGELMAESLGRFKLKVPGIFPSP
jgi:hypothetical protein|tara:strand:- start:791 stop:898 length:108 start_codon:yes stop_codon:yes gene_type:complete